MNQQISLEQQRRIQLDILQNIDAFCKKNSINYSLAFGTLIGAVRHRGYIPWDDDIDIMMTRDNYEKFRAIYKSDRYPLVDLKIDPTHPVSMGKVYDSRTFFYYQEKIKRKYGLFIDIFPFDKIPENEEERELWLKEIRKYIQYNTYKNNTYSYLFSLSSIKERLFGCIVKVFCNRIRLHSKLEELYVKYNETSSHILSVPAVMIMNNANHYKVFPSNLFCNYTTIEFEGGLFQCIKEFDSFLRIYYGNYMELPPVEQRVGKHGIVAYYK